MNEAARIPIVQQVINSMRDYIITSPIPVGQKLPTEKEWCEQLQVGRGTVREAFRVLEAKGLVEIKPGRGAFVAGIRELEREDIVEWFIKNEVELKDYMEVRSAVEPMAVRLMARRGSDEEQTQLERTHRKFIKAVEDNDVSAMARYDEKLHRQIVEATKNKMLIFISKKIDDRIRDFRMKTFRVPQNAQNAIQAHHDIVRALKERDEEVAELYARRHIHLIYTDMDAVIKN